GVPLRRGGAHTGAGRRGRPALPLRCRTRGACWRTAAQGTWPPAGPPSPAGPPPHRPAPAAEPALGSVAPV
ncbi:MAG: hypothetical protein AVDCRST_MAG07-2285, partial [uncultured Frankineae bacterium]